MTVLIVNPNPVFDRTITIPELIPGAVIRTVDVETTAGGKGATVKFTPVRKCPWRVLQYGVYHAQRRPRWAPGVCLFRCQYFYYIHILRGIAS